MKQNDMKDNNLFQEKYNELLLLVENLLANYHKGDNPDCMYDPFNYILTAGGKRIRPVLAMICAGACGAPPESALKPAAAVEIMHNFTLVHDDIMDDSPMRRGRQTVHEKWDTPTAILLGDVMVGHAYALLPGCNEHARATEINRAFTRGLIEVCEGQAFDMQFNERRDVSIDDYMNMIGKKTSRLLETAAVIGVHCANAPERIASAAELFARELGLGFQLQDDLLDILADQAELGKTIGLDIAEGKKTFLIITAKERATSQEDVELINEFYKNNGLPIDKAPVMRELFERLGVFDSAGEEIKLHFDNARKYISEFSDGFYVDMLRWLVDKIDKRKY
ncbi:MAG: polyprenyl synthetase family protein [Candidatus Kapaibacterium sp.]